MVTLDRSRVAVVRLQKRFGSLDAGPARLWDGTARPSGGPKRRQLRLSSICGISRDASPAGVAQGARGGAP